jgi:DMSO/TMAO reductase YedYZ molybdopterin-dependent catalytic subunit
VRLWRIPPDNKEPAGGLGAALLDFGEHRPTAEGPSEEPPTMSIVSPGFSGRRRSAGPELPPGQYLVEDFPVLSAGPTPRVRTEAWEFTVRTETGAEHRWDWAAFRKLPTERITVDLHCVTRWSKLGTGWEGVSLDTLLAEVDTAADYALVHAYGGYTTNLPLADLREGQAWIAFRYDGADLSPEHGGPARLLVPHLYLWKSAKWVRGIALSDSDQPGFWESVGYHNYGDPWREQRYWGD